MVGDVVVEVVLLQVVGVGGVAAGGRVRGCYW